MRITKLTSLALVFALFLYACNSEEEPCPNFPSIYTNSFDIADLDPIGVYFFDGERLTRTDDNPDEFKDLVLPEESLMEFVMNETLIQSFSITSDSTIDVNVSFGEMETSFAANYELQRSPNFYTIYSETFEDFIFGGVEIAEDCSFVDVCRWLVFTIDETDLDLTRARGIDGCYRLSEDTFEQDYVDDLSQLDAQRKILLIKFSQVFLLE